MPTNSIEQDHQNLLNNRRAQIQVEDRHFIGPSLDKVMTESWPQQSTARLDSCHGREF
jgi:hypothetical protein